MKNVNLIYLTLPLFFILGPMVGNVLGEVSETPFPKTFSPHMVGHVNLGCPTNSSCNRPTGLKRQQWIQLLETGKSSQKK